MYSSDLAAPSARDLSSHPNDERCSGKVLLTALG